MSFVGAITTGFNKYVTFTGRAARSEYWFWLLFWFVAYAVATFLDVMVGLGLIGALVSLALLLPSIAVAVRRLHDLDRSGWWFLLVLTGIGSILLIVWYCMKGTTGPNSYGPDPL